jgi:predicted dienelactone hydrolase
MLRRFLVGFLALIIVSSASVGIGLIVTAPKGPAPESSSARLLAPGPHPVAKHDFTFVDESRATPAHRDFEGATGRTLVSSVWYPKDADGRHPLVIYSHGFMSTRTGGAYLAEHLASHGYVVLSADFPATNFNAPGGPNVADAARQPADVSFLIDSILALDGDKKPFQGDVDPERIGVMGLSLGGLTTTLATFHPELRDPRIRAAVSIAGPGSLFTESFFRTADVPFLMVAGTGDAMVDYESNALVIPRRAPTGALVSIENGSHTGFADIADPLFRFADHPDSFGCGALMENIEPVRGQNPFPGLGGAENGIVLDEDAPLPCTGAPLSNALHPGRQHMITLLAVSDFFQSVFGDDGATREAAARHLQMELARDFPEASFMAYRGAGS